MPNEFRKPYEYKEDKRGLIILFISMILSIDTLQTIFLVAQNDKYPGDIPFLRSTSLIIAGAFILYTIYTSIIVYRMKNNFVVKAKRYIIIRTFLFLISFLFIFLNRLKYEELILDEHGQYLSKDTILYLEFFIPLFFIMIFSVIWYLYFTYSKRCQYQ